MMENLYFLIKLDDLGYHYFRKHPHWPKVKVALQPHVQCFSTDLLEAIEADGWWNGGFWMTRKNPGWK